MLGAPEVISMNALLIKSLGGKKVMVTMMMMMMMMMLMMKVIDVGVYTGASSLGAALALPEGRWQLILFFEV